MTEQLDAVLAESVEKGIVPNVVAVVGTRNGTVYEGFAGERVAGAAGDPVGASTHFRIMSMTKAVATVAALQLVEQGVLDLDAPVETYCKSFAELMVLDGFDAGTPLLRPPASRATVHQLLTHTTGLGYWFWNADLVAWEAATGTPNVLSGSDAIFTAPLTADPGTRFQYGINTDWLGRVIESITGRTLDIVIEEAITGPLGMSDTAFRAPDAGRERVVPIHVPTEDGGWAPTDIDLNPSPDYWAGGHGLFSTPRDYLRFQRALLRDGELDGARILRPDTVSAAFTNQLGNLEFPPSIPTADPASSFSFEVGDGFTWGYGLLLNTADVPGARRAGSGAWAGLANTHFWVDRSAGITGAVFAQTLPFAPPDQLEMYARFERAVYSVFAPR